MIAHLIAAAVVIVAGALFIRVWVALPPERTPAAYAREVLEDRKDDGDMDN